MTKRHITPHKGGRTVSAPRARIRPQTLQRIRATMQKRKASFADLLEETYSGGNEMDDSSFHRSTGRGPFCPTCKVLVQWVGKRNHRIDGDQLVQYKSIAFGQDKHYRRDNLIDLTPDDVIEPVNLMKQKYQRAA